MNELLFSFIGAALLKARLVCLTPSISVLVGFRVGGEGRGEAGRS